MRFSKILTPCTTINNRSFPVGSIVATSENNDRLVCSNFKTPRCNKLELYLYLSKDKKWYKVRLKNNVTEAMWNYYRQNNKKQLKKRFDGNYNQMMQHDRKHKHSSGGIRLTPYTDNSITDYECSKTPMHDFPRSRYVAWNY